MRVLGRSFDARLHLKASQKLNAPAQPAAALECANAADGIISDQ
jgi:hypothetical protein